MFVNKFKVDIIVYCYECFLKLSNNISFFNEISNYCFVKDIE